MTQEKLIKLLKESKEFSIDFSLNNSTSFSKKTQNWLETLKDDEKNSLNEVVEEIVDFNLIQILNIFDGVHDKNLIPIEAKHEQNKISGIKCKQLHDLYETIK